MKKNGADPMRMSCARCKLRSFDCFAPLTEAEEEFMVEFKSGELDLDPGSSIVLEGSSSPHLFTVLEGIGIRHKTLADGRRQVIGFVFPGDFVGLQAAVMEEMQHTVEAVTKMLLCVFRRNDFYKMFVRVPERSFDVTWLAAREEHLLGDQLLTVGRRSAEERVAYGLYMLHRRAKEVGLASEGKMEMPFTQQDVADALGLSLVHTNKTLKRLKEKKIAEWSARTLKIFDAEKLKAVGGIEDDTARLRPLM